MEEPTRSTFVGEEIEVRLEGEPGQPAWLVWRGEEHAVREIISRWQKLEMGKRPWYSRRHRDHYVVRVESGRIFELYRHRGPGKRYWVLLRELHHGDASAP